jgi:hypothetical protein
MLRTSRTAIVLSLAAGVLAVYLLTFNGGVTSADEASLLAATESLIKQGDLRTDQLVWAVWAHGWQAQGTPGPDGRVYSKKGIGLPVILAPAMALAVAIPVISKTHMAFLLAALISLGVVLASYAVALRWSRREGAALALALIVAFATPVWPYSRTLFQEVPSALALLLAILFITSPASRRNALCAGAALGAAILIRSTNAVALAPLGLYALHRYRMLARREAIALLAALIAPVAIAVLLTGLSNWQRFGSPLNSGYSGYETFTTPLWRGLAGQLVSSRKGLLWFAPILLAALVGIPSSLRRRRAETLLVLGIAGALIAMFSVWYDWGGGLAWGPRFAVTAVPLLALLMLPILESPQRVPTRVLLFALVVLSVAIQFAAATTQYTQTDGVWPVGEAFRTLVRNGPPGLDIAWLRARPQPQWLPMLGFAAIAAAAVVVGAGAWRSHRAPVASGSRWAVTAAGVLGALALSGALLSLTSIRADIRLQGGDDYRDLAERLSTVALPSDSILVDNHTRTEFFLSEDRSRAPRYDFLRSDALRPEAEALLGRLVSAPGTIWLVSDRPSAAPVPKPEEAWLDAHAFRGAEHAFSDYARLLAYRVPQSELLQPGPAPIRFDNGWRVADSLLEEAPGVADNGIAPQELAFSIKLAPSASAARGVAASVQLLGSDGALVWQLDRALDPAAPLTEMRGAVPLGGAGPHRLLLVLYDAGSGARARITAPGSAAGQDIAELASWP